jgi:hypothetical protein
MIPGFLIALVTFPGVMVHEMAHQLFCRLARVAVFDVCYFRLGNPAGYVAHEHPRTTAQQVLIATGPFLVNSIVGPLIAFPGVIPVMRFGGGSIIDYALVWLGVSIAMHAFPSTGDAKTMWHAVTARETSLLAKLFVIPLVALIYVGALGSFFWLDAIYGVALSMALPTLLVQYLA